MTLPYSSATSGRNAMSDIESTLRTFGCTKFGALNDYATGELILQFEYRGRMVELRASAKGYAAAWLKENPYGPRRKGARKQHEDRALAIGQTAIYSILRDWIKGQFTAIETGIFTFEGAFLGHFLLPSGERVLELVEKRGILALETGTDGEEAGAE